MYLSKRKYQALRIASLYDELGYTAYAERIRSCMTSAKIVEKRGRNTFPWYLNNHGLHECGKFASVDYETRFRLVDANFCRVRLCPICQWRKSVRWQAIGLKSLPLIQQEIDNYAWLFLTLTLKNCELTVLRETVEHLNKSFQRWTRWKKFPAKGWVKSLEISLDKNDANKCHPHFHVLLIVPSGYYKHNYWQHGEWVEGWRQTAKLDYDPIVNIKGVNKEKESSVIPEILKYGVKPSDLAEVNSNQLFHLTEQLYNLRAINKGGILQKYFRNVGNDNVDLVGEAKNDEFYPTGWEQEYLWAGDRYLCDWSYKGLRTLEWQEIHKENGEIEVTEVDVLREVF